MKLKLNSKSAEETRNIAAVLGRATKGALAVLLRGDYGAGKTTFVQGLGAGLGVREPIRSPSYNILRRYEIGERVLLHVDLYRTGSQADIDELAIGDLLQEDGVLAVEWPAERADYSLDIPTLTVDFGIPTGAMSDGGEEEPRVLLFDCDEECPIALVEVLVAFSDR